MAVPEARIRTVEGANPEEVGQINDALASAEPAPEPVIEEPVEEQDPTQMLAPAGVNLGPGKGLPRLEEGDEQLLLGRPSDFPNENIKRGLGTTTKARVPDELWDFVPALVEAAKDPNAPASLHALLELIDLKTRR